MLPVLPWAPKGWYEWHCCCAFWNERFVILAFSVPSSRHFHPWSKLKTRQPKTRKALGSHPGSARSYAGLESFVSNSKWILGGLALTLEPSPAGMRWEISPLICIASSRAKVTLDIQSYDFPNICRSATHECPPSASKCSMVGNSGLGLIPPWHDNRE